MGAAERSGVDSGAGTSSKPTLSPEQRAQLEAFTTRKTEQLKAATVLLDAGLHAMAPEHLREAALSEKMVGYMRLWPGFVTDGR